MRKDSATVKENVNRFDDDVRRTGSYAYTTERVSSRLANARISEGIAEIFDFKDKRVLDLGCGDGTFTLDFVAFGAREVLGIDPAAVAIESASRKAAEAGLSDKVLFVNGNIYDSGIAPDKGSYDCVVLRGVLHHLPDPKRAVACAALLADSMIILEPNGYSPILKMLERFSKYHVEHEEQSFFASTLAGWVNATELRVREIRHLNLVPMFCPDWMARVCKTVEPLVERAPLLRTIACGQCLLLATRP